MLTVIIPVIRTDLITKCLEKLYLYTDNFYCIVVDQSVRGIDMGLRDRFKNLTIIRTPVTATHYTGNLGFAQGCSYAISLVDTPYFMLLNDDVEMIHSGWWDGVLASFKQITKASPQRPAICVNLASIRLADWSVGREAGDDFDILPYRERYTNWDWEFLINQSHYVNEHLTIQPTSVFDGVTLYASVIDTAKYKQIGGMDNRYYPGSGEDYDFSCLSSMWGYRSINTTLSWCFHHWSSSFKSLRDEEEIQQLKIPELNWNHNHEKWGERFNIWGIQCRECKKEGKDTPLLTTDGITAACPLHPQETYDMPQNTLTPL